MASNNDLTRALQYLQRASDNSLTRLRDHDFLTLVELIGISPATKGDIPQPHRSGSQWLVSVRETNGFGPVVSVGIGQEPAQAVPEPFLPPVPILVPAPRASISALIAGNAAIRALAEKHRRLLIPKLTTLVERLASFAIAASITMAPDNPVHLQQLSIDPAVCLSSGELVAVDGHALIKRNSQTESPDRSTVTKDRPASSLRPFFEPRGVAVVGVGPGDATPTGKNIAAGLFGLGRRDVACVHAGGGVVKLGSRTVPMYHSLRDLQLPPELVVVTVTGEAASRAIDQAVNVGAKALLVISDATSDATSDDEADGGGDGNPGKQILDQALQAGLRLMGPNCLGVIHRGEALRSRMNTFPVIGDAFRELTRGLRPVALVGQSGDLVFVQLTSLHHAVYPKIVADYGDGLDVEPGELIRYIAQNETVTMIGVYLRRFRRGEGRRFVQAVSETSIPVVVYLAGRGSTTRAGERDSQDSSSQRRTNTMDVPAPTTGPTDDHTIAAAAFAQHGVIQAETIEDQTDLIQGFALLHGKKRTGRRVALVTNAEYEKTLALDWLGSLVPANLSRPTAEKLKQILPPKCAVESFLNITERSDDSMYEGVLRILLSDGGVDAVVVSVVPRSGSISATDREMARTTRTLADRIVAVTQTTTKPVVASVTVHPGAQTPYGRIGSTLQEGGVPTFSGARAAVRALQAYLLHEEHQ